jgi:acetyltransferase
MAVDALAEHWLAPGDLPSETCAALDRVLPPNWSHGNPVDILGDATGKRYGDALAAVMRKPAGDAVLVINCPTALADGAEAARAVAAASAAADVPPVLAAWLGSEASSEPQRVLREAAVPVFDRPEQAVLAFCHLVEFRRNQELLLETPSAGVLLEPKVVADAVALIETVRRDGRTLLNEDEAKRLLALVGIPTVETRIAATPAEAARIAGEIGGPVALKILSSDITHKSDVGGVALALRSAAAVEKEAVAMLARVGAARPDAKGLRFTVQAMVERRGAAELLVGLAPDQTFGPVILFGQGGTAAEVIADRAVGLPPLNSVLARDMIGRTRVARLLRGFRNVPPVRPGVVEDVLLRLSEIAVQLPDILELDVNPLLADAAGVIALDARIVVSATSAAPGRCAITPYPRALEKPIALGDGTVLAMRPIRPEDEVAIAAMVGQCTAEDRRLRFLGPLKALDHELAARLSQIDYDREMAFVAVEPGSGFGRGPIYGVVRIIGDPERRAAEFAILVRSDLKGRGLGYRLLSEIVAYARGAGYGSVHGDVLRENATMLKMAQELGFVVESAERNEDTRRVVLDLSASLSTIVSSPQGA